MLIIVFKGAGKLSELFPGWGDNRQSVIRWDNNIVVYNVFFHIACMLITLKRLRNGF